MHFSTKLFTILYSTALLVSSQSQSAAAPKQPGNIEFLELRDTLLQFIAEDPKEHAPPLIRISFHDLFNWDPATGDGGPKGCILVAPVAEMEENKGVSEAAIEVMDYVVAAHPNIAFTSGDVLSLAGKIAVEVAYPCLQIPWRWGRNSCAPNTSTEKETGPPGNISTKASWQPFLSRFNFSLEEMGVLTAGAHGIATAAAKVESSGWGPFTMAWKNGGKDWIANTDSPTGPMWTHQVNENGKEQYIRQDANIGRLPSDMVFFPSTLAQIKNSSSSPSLVSFDEGMRDTETFLRKFIQQDRSAFDQEFAKVFAKMLEIGLNGTNSSSLQQLEEMGAHSRFAAGTTCAGSEGEEFPVALWYLVGWTPKGITALVGCIVSALFGLGGLVYLS